MLGSVHPVPAGEVFVRFECILNEQCQFWQVVLGAPECLSYTFNEEGKVTSFTGEDVRMRGTCFR